MEDLLAKLFIAETSQEVLDISEKIASNVNASELLQVLAKYEVSLAGNGLEREAGLLGMAGLALQPFTLPFLIEHIPAILDHFADKGSPVREAAQLALDRIIQKTPPQAFKKVLLGLMQGANARKWQSKVGAIKAIEAICDIAPGNRFLLIFKILYHLISLKLLR
jgi:elongation factor 3